MGFHHVSQDCLDLLTSRSSHLGLPKYWDYRGKPPCPAIFYFFSAMLSYFTQDLLPEQSIQDAFPKSVLTGYRNCGLDNFHWRKDWGNSDECKLQKEDDNRLNQCSSTTHSNISQCSKCVKIFNNSSNVHRHNTSHTGEKPSKCKDCGKSFQIFSFLTEHQKIHPEKKIQKCKECGKTFHQCSHFTEHENIRTREKPYKCKARDKVFKTCLVLSTLGGWGGSIASGQEFETSLVNMVKPHLYFLKKKQPTNQKNLLSPY